MARYVQKFISVEAAAGLVLVVVLIVALLIANSNLYDFYHWILHIPIQVRVGDLDLHKPALLWVNEGLMALFFLILALEMKREILEGQLSRPGSLVLPLIGAIGGISLPALIYILINRGDPDSLQGWPIPTTTDIAFALGVVAVLGKIVPPSLKAFLVALSIVDDILAVAIIALFYTQELSLLNFSLAFAAVIFLIILNYAGVTRLGPYLLVGTFIWVCVLKSNIHATLAGAVIGFIIPCRCKDANGHSPLRHLEHILHPWVAFFVLPIFVFVNGGIVFEGTDLYSFFKPVSLGVALGLCLGKPIGIIIFSLIPVRCGFINLPPNTNWLQFLGIAAVTGIGFTMSMFLTSLAFYGTEYEPLARQGVLMGSLLSVILGSTALYFGHRCQTAVPA